MSGNILILGADGYIGKDLQTVIDDTKNIYCIDKTYKEKVMKETNKVYFNLLAKKKILDFYPITLKRTI